MSTVGLRDKFHADVVVTRIYIALNLDTSLKRSNMPMTIIIND